MARKAKEKPKQPKREYKVFEHPADAGVRGRGTSLEEALANAARALFVLAADIDTVRPRQRVRIHLVSTDRASLLVDLLNELIALMDLEGLLFCDVEDLEVRTAGDRLSLDAIAVGEKLCPERHRVRVEPKAATYSQLLVGRIVDGCDPGSVWVAQCIVDI